MYNRIGIRNFSSTKELEAFIDEEKHNNLIIEFYDISVITNELIYTIDRYKNDCKEIQIHLNNYQPLTTLTSPNTIFWLEIDIDKLETIPLLDTKAIFNIKVESINIQNITKILNYFSTIKTGDIYIVDKSLYNEITNPSTVFKIRNKLIKQSKTKPIKYCLNEKYIVFNCLTNKLEPCIDINKQFNTKYDIDIFQNSDYKDCNYYCNKIIYQYEDKLKKLIRKKIT